MYFDFDFQKRESKRKQIKRLKCRLDKVEEVVMSLVRYLDLSVTNNYPFGKYGEWGIVAGEPDGRSEEDCQEG